jgi:PST family polysaccharide transporter
MSLRGQVLRGGAYLALRQLLTLGISFVGIVALTRLIGPEDYGRYVGSLQIVLFLTLVGRFGVDAYVIRRAEPLTPEGYGLAFGVMAVSSLLLTTATVGLAAVAPGWLVDPAFVRPLQWLVLALPLSLLLAPALATLDRNLDYRSIALLELGNAVLFYAFAIGLASADLGVWAPVIAYWVAQVFMLGGSLLCARVPVARPRSLEGLGDMLRYGLGYTASSWLHDLRTLANPIVVGGVLGPAAVGYVSLALRVCELAGFARAAGYRLSLSALARVAAERDRLRRALGDAMLLQTVAVGPPLVVAAIASPWIFELGLGEEWAPVADVFPFVALAYLLAAPFSMERSLLYVVGDNRGALVFSAVYVALLFGSAAVLVRALDDPQGYGVAELVALAAYAVVHVRAARHAPVGYRRIAPWLAAFAPPLFLVFVPLPLAPLLALPLAVVLLAPAPRRTIRGVLGDLRGAAAAS